MYLFMLLNHISFDNVYVRMRDTYGIVIIRSGAAVPRCTRRAGYSCNSYNKYYDKYYGLLHVRVS